MTSSAGVGVPDEFVRGLPKAEVHVHLEGCFSLDDVRCLALEAGESVFRDVERLFDAGVGGLDLAEFLKVLDWTCSLVRTPEQLARAAYNFALREASSGVRYADLIFNPTHWSAWRDRLDALVDALDAGFCDAEADRLPRVALCVSLLRQQTASEGLELVDWILSRRHPRIVALSIDGNEAAAGRTGPRFAAAFRKAADSGLRRTVHAGESSGPEGVRDALEFLLAERIDHGVRSIEDPALIAELATLKVPLNVCPSSNVKLGLYPSLTEHPVDALRRAGVRVTLNTDDPALMRTDLLSEYIECVRTFGWDVSTLRELARASIEASFCPVDLRGQLLAELSVFSSRSAG